MEFEKYLLLKMLFLINLDFHNTIYYYYKFLIVLPYYIFPLMTFYFKFKNYLLNTSMKKKEIIIIFE